MPWLVLEQSHDRMGLQLHFWSHALSPCSLETWSLLPKLPSPCAPGQGLVRTLLFYRCVCAFYILKSHPTPGLGFLFSIHSGSIFPFNPLSNVKTLSTGASVSWGQGKAEEPSTWTSCLELFHQRAMASLCLRSWTSVPVPAHSPSAIAHSFLNALSL